MDSFYYKQGSTYGTGKTEVTDDKFFVSTWVVNRQTGIWLSSVIITQMVMVNLIKQIRIISYFMI